MIRLLAVISCILFSYCSFGQQAVDTVPRPARIDSGHAPMRVDSSLGLMRIDSSRGLVRTDSSHRVVRPDSSRLARLQRNNIFQFFRNAVSRGGHQNVDSLPVALGRHADSSVMASALHTKAETPFKAYEGKIIRHINIKNFGFEQVFTDTSKRLQYSGTKLLNKLHHKTRDWVIRNELFIKEGSKLSAYKLADNERLIRSLNYIQDARILIDTLPGNGDSVDLTVIVKDLFSIGGSIGELGVNPTAFRGEASDANAFGLGQRIQVGIFEEQLRSPNFGYSLLYSKTNIGHSFVNGTVSYTQIRGDLTTGTPDEQARFITLARPLYAVQAHLAGAFTMGDFESFNRYAVPDSIFYKYHYQVHDAWLGWNLGTEKFLSNTTVRDRRFLGVRYFRNHFYDVPTQVGDNFNFRFNDREAILGQFTFFRQDFYKTNYIYGFGTTEDVPSGYNIALTGGWYKQINLRRPYAGVDANAYVASKKGDFIQYFLRSGVFPHGGQLQDASILVGTSIYSRLFVFSRVKIRQYFNFSYTHQFNRVGIDPLTIDNVFGLRYFSGDSTFGDQRITFHSETTFFLNYKLLGFKFAPFAFGDLSLLTPEGEPFNKSNLYHGLGAGIRSRNENLIFNTIELRFVYFPRPTEYNNSFKIMLNTGIQFRYNSTYVTAPDIVFLNTDGLNSIY
jgi:hypothetical protein